MPFHVTYYCECPDCPDEKQIINNLLSIEFFLILMCFFHYIDFLFCRLRGRRRGRLWTTIRAWWSSSRASYNYNDDHAGNYNYHFYYGANNNFNNRTNNNNHHYNDINNRTIDHYFRGATHDNNGSERSGQFSCSWSRTWDSSSSTGNRLVWSWGAWGGWTRGWRGRWWWWGKRSRSPGNSQSRRKWQRRNRTEETLRASVFNGDDDHHHHRVYCGSNDSADACGRLWSRSWRLRSRMPNDLSRQRGGTVGRV